MTAVEPIPEAWPQALSQRFAPHRQLGRGGFGTVFEATDRARGAKVAVKVLRADRLNALQSFKREFRALADLAHAHLVPLYELGREGDTWFLVMEPIDGLDLLEGTSREARARAAGCSRRSRSAWRFCTRAAGCTAISSPRTCA
jgi:serine/threonine protein kinase